MSYIKKYNFSRSKRLRAPKDFKDVFQKSARSTSYGFSILSRYTTMGVPRIGIIVAKKAISKAIERNRVRRIVRESFRFHQHKLLGLDIVVLVRSAAAKQGHAEVRLCLEKHWKELALQRAKS